MSGENWSAGNTEFSSATPRTASNARRFRAVPRAICSSSFVVKVSPVASRTAASRFSSDGAGRDGADSREA
jgi:hypothetical protein